jgi:hypothetical protein
VETLRTLGLSLSSLEPAERLGSRQGMNNPNVGPDGGRPRGGSGTRAQEPDRCREILNWLDERAQATGLAYPQAAACRAGDPGNRARGRAALV